MFTDKYFENKVQKSFELARKDVYKLYEHFNLMRNEIEELKKTNKEILLTMAKGKSTSAIKKQYVVSKQGSKVHQANCLFARNISKKNKIIFSTKTKALNAGYKLCSCLAY